MQSPRSNCHNLAHAARALQAGAPLRPAGCGCLQEHAATMMSPARLVRGRHSPPGRPSPVSPDFTPAMQPALHPPARAPRFLQFPPAGTPSWPWSHPAARTLLPVGARPRFDSPAIVRRNFPACRAYTPVTALVAGTRHGRRTLAHSAWNAQSCPATLALAGWCSGPPPARGLP